MAQLYLNKTNYNLAKYFALSAFGGVFLLSVAFLQPFSFTDNSYAEEVDKTSSVDMSVTVEPVIEIWTTDTNDETISAANIELDPDESIATTTVRTHVSTSNTTGYTLTIQSESTDAKMIHENESITKTIDPITGEGTSTTNWTKNKDLNNMWGYSIGNNDSYLGVPGSSSDSGTDTSANTINETSGPSNDSSTDITFAAKADTTLPAGTYKDTVIFSAIANPAATPIEDGMYMQDATSDMCAVTETWTSGTTNQFTLKDKRDNIEYKVRKLKDGHCWMVQNFRMTADTLSVAGHKATGQTNSAVLTSEDTNLDSGVTYAMPSNAAWQNETATAEGAADASLLPKDSTTGAKASGEEAIAHGAYYSWATAVANKSSIGTDSKQTSSICPKNWRLADPNKGSSDNNNEYYKLFNDSTNGYGGNYADFMKAFNYYYDTSAGASVGGATYYLAGRWYSDSGQRVRYAGSVGYWWSSTSHSNAGNAWLSNATTSSVRPADYYGRHYGFSVRCVL